MSTNYSADLFKFIEKHEPNPVEYRVRRGNIIHGIWITWEYKIFDDRVEYTPMADENYPLFGGHGTLKDMKMTNEEILQKAKASSLTVFFDEKLVEVPEFYYRSNYRDFDDYDSEYSETLVDETRYMFESKAKEYLKRFKELADKYNHQYWFISNLCEDCGGSGHTTIQNQETGEAEDYPCQLCLGVGAYQHKDGYNV
jgi:hypothetical protein